MLNKNEDNKNLDSARIHEISNNIYETIQLIRDYCEYNENYEKISPLVPTMRQLNALADELYFLLREDNDYDDNDDNDDVDI